MFSGKKKTLGFKGKTREREEVEKDYQEHAFHAGHKLRIVRQKREQCETECNQLEKDIESHTQRMNEILLEMNDILLEMNDIKVGQVIKEQPKVMVTQ